MLAASLLLLVLASASPSDVAVSVTDPSGGRIPGASVEIDPGSSKNLTARTDARGEARLPGVEGGEHRVRVTMAGFEPWEKKIKVKDGASTIEAKLKIARLAEAVSVSPDDSRSAAGGYKTVLTEADLANLPDDPDELEAALRAIAGPQAAMRVNGFSGGRLPPKSQIRQIRFVMNPYAAEFHESQPMLVDIQTKPGLGDWSKTVRSGFRDDSLNARSPLAPSRVPDSYRRLSLDLAGPLVKNRTSLSLSAEGRMTDTARTVFAQTPSGGLSQLADSATDRFDLSARLEHGWGKTHSLRGEFLSLSRNESGLGIGGFDLPERGYKQDRRQTTTSLTDNGVVFGRVASEVRFQGNFESVDFTSNSQAPSVRVMGAFGAGGAGVSGGRSSRDLELTSNFDLSVRKKHALRFGFILKDVSVTSDEQRNANGSFTFADLSSYQAGRPSLFTQRTGDPRVEYGQRQMGLYFQDDAKLSKNLTVAAGLRVEGQSHIDGLVNLAPRASFTYSPNPRTTIRGGVGRFFNWYEPDIYEQTLRLDGLRETETLITNPSWPDPYAGGSLGNPRSTRIRASPDLTLPLNLRTSLGFERNLPGRLRLMVDYSYTRGSRELRSRNRSVAGSNLSVREIESTSRSSRHAVDARLNLTPSPAAKVGFFVGYLWQNLRNESEGALSLPANENDLAAEWGRSLNGATHRVFGLLNVNPTKRISIGALLQAQSGNPFDITTGRDDNGDTLFGDRPAGVTRNTGTGPSRVNVDLRVGWAKSFGAKRAPRPGEGMRVIRLGGGDGVPDTSSPGEPQRYRVSLYAQAFNVLNRTNPVAVGTILGSPLFGRAVVTDPGRRIELGATFAF
ncbi:MAG: TonB-dependent receptor [Vicinamibacteria bacterium]